MIAGWRAGKLSGGSAPAESGSRQHQNLQYRENIDIWLAVPRHLKFETKEHTF
jgi:hypothetical protein